MKKLIIIISLISLTICGKEIKKMVTLISGNLGKMKERLEKAPKGIKSKYHPIINKGYEFYSHTLQTIYNPKIMDDTFNEYLKDIIPTYFKNVDKKIRDNIIHLISLAEFTPFNNIFIPKFLFKKGESKNKGLFIAVMSEKNTDTIDLLFLIMESNFNLGKDYFIATKSNRILFWGSTKEIIVSKPRFLTMDDLDYLFNFLQICMFSRVKKILNAIEG
jgi:hypothetical protein